MKNIILIALLFSNVYAQGFECDNNFGDCGTPDQSGGGGGRAEPDRARGTSSAAGSPSEAGSVDAVTRRGRCRRHRRA